MPPENVNGDCAVDIFHLEVLVSKGFGTGEKAGESGPDLNGDGSVEFNDFAVLPDCWPAGCD